MALNEFSRMTPEQRSACGKKGHAKAMETIRRKKEMKEILNTLLSMPLKTGKIVTAEEVKNFTDIKGKNITVDQAMMVVLVQKALKGDLSAITTIRDTIGEKPVEKVNVDAKVTKNPLEDLSADELRELIKKNDTN